MLSKEIAARVVQAESCNLVFYIKLETYCILDNCFQNFSINIYITNHVEEVSVFHKEANVLQEPLEDELLTQ